MKLFKRRGQGAVEAEEPDATPAPEIIQEAAEERQEFDDDVEVAHNRRGLNPRWSLRGGAQDVDRLEARAVADRESDTAEKLFIKAEREAEERGGHGIPR